MLKLIVGKDLLHSLCPPGEFCSDVIVLKFMLEILYLCKSEDKQALTSWLNADEAHFSLG